MKKPRKLKKVWILIFIIICVLFILGIYSKNKNDSLNKKKEEALKEEIKKHYGSYVVVNNSAKLYDADEKEIGNISKGYELSLDKIEISKDTKYFKIINFEDVYIKYTDVDVIDELSSNDERYKIYIPFNKNIKTKDKVNFYDNNYQLVLTLNNSYDFPVIVMDDEYYGVEFDNRLLYVSKEDVEEIYDNTNTDLENISGVVVLNYHSFYDPSDEAERSSCTTSICHSTTQFKTHLDYIKDNNILTLKMKEFEDYVDGKIQLPKSILITIDDGFLGTRAVEVLTEYKMYGTIFLVTSWYDPKTYPKSEYIEFHSHSHNMHNQGDCPTGQGGAIQCKDREYILNDLKQSREMLDNTTYFCYPFYEYNNYSIEMLKEAGFTLSFAGQIGDMISRVGVDKFRVPRLVITTYTELSDFDELFSKIK